MLSVPKKANDAMHLSMLEGASVWSANAPSHTHPTESLISSSCCNALGFDGNIDSQGELILQESFQVWDPKTLIRKGRDRHLFLFEMSLVFSKDVKDSNGRSKYLYKSKLFVRDPAIISVPCSSITAEKMNIKTKTCERWAQVSALMVNKYILLSSALSCVLIFF